MRVCIVKEGFVKRVYFQSTVLSLSSEHWEIVTAVSKYSCLEDL